jgi:integrase/recombinase XerD
LKMNGQNQKQRQKLELWRHRFLEWLKALNYSQRTVVSYAGSIKALLDWLVENIEFNALSDITAAHLQHFQIALSQTEFSGKDGEKKHFSASAQTVKLAAVKKFFTWLWQEGHLVYNPSASIQMPKVTKRLPRNILTPREARKIIEATPFQHPIDIRDRAILETLYSTGVRRTELINLQIYDIDWDANTLRVEEGKNGLTRLIPLTESVRAVLKLYLEDARPILALNSSNTHLFVTSKTGSPMYGQDIVELVDKAARRAKITKHVTPHTLRHSFATHLLKGKADIRQIQKLLGHRNLSSTEIYTRVDLSDLQKVIKRSHPRERGRKDNNRQ